VAASPAVARVEPDLPIGANSGAGAGAPSHLGYALLTLSGGIACGPPALVALGL